MRHFISMLREGVKKKHRHRRNVTSHHFTSFLFTSFHFFFLLFSLLLQFYFFDFFHLYLTIFTYLNIFISLNIFTYLTIFNSLTSLLLLFQLLFMTSSQQHFFSFNTITKFGQQVAAQLAIVKKLATRWRHLYVVLNLATSPCHLN